ncbi:MAG: phosphogluconate dehydrogenase C-terminal domain-containing protein [Verrucomicrobiia bacterium]
MNAPLCIALLGAGGKMGCRIIDHLKSDPTLRLLCMEVSPAGLQNLAQRGVQATDMAKALPQADVAILALPDRLLGKVAREAVPKLKPGAMVITLDPAAAHAGELPARPDISYFVTHPCHPSVFDCQDDPEARADFFGGTKAPMPIVCALMQGPDEHYALGEKLARAFFAPVTRAHRVTVEQMAILEPAMSETTAACLITAIREAMDEAIRRGVPAEAARDFMYGHIKVPLGIAFGHVNFPFSDGAKLIIEYGRQRLLRPDWKSVFEPQSVKEQVKTIVSGVLPPTPAA